MNEFWKAFFANNSIKKPDFSQIDLATLSAGIPLAHYGCIKVSGPEAQKFLQGQISNDVTKLNKQSWQFCAYCNHKGRIIAFVWLAFVDGDYSLSLPSDAMPLTLAELKKFGAFSKVTIEQAEQFAILGWIGEVPANLQQKADICMQYAGKIQQSILFINKDELTDLDCEIYDNSLWSYLSILNQIPIIYKAQQERFTPHQLNLQHLNALDFKKGCYRGQEIVARMHYLGKLKQALHPIELTVLESTPLPENLILEDGKNLGEWVNSLEISKNNYLGLAVLNESLLSAIKNKNLIRLADEQQFKMI